MNARAIGIVLAYLAVSVQPAVEAAEPFVASVVQVKDGDSVVVSTGGTEYQARLGEIDAPEYGQAWGNAARQALRRLVLHRQVNVTVQDIDSYGRLVVQLRLADVSINRQLVADGHAWAYRDYLRDATLLELEAAARQQGLGLWAQAEPVAPWLYRRGERRATRSESPITSLWNRISASFRSLTRNFSCGRKSHCSQMNSCSEAQFYLQQCGLTTIDGDNDGKPCERTLCRVQPGRP